MRLFKSAIVLALLLLFVTVSANGAEMREWQLAELLAQPQARSVTSGNNVVLTLYYSDGSTARSYYAEASISPNTVASRVLNLYEDGAIVAATRFSGSDGSINLSDENYDTLGEVVDAINSDTSGYWNASLGEDAHRNVNSLHIRPKTDIIDDANVSAKSPVTFYLDHDLAKAFMIGAKAEVGARVRLKQVDESTTASRGPHFLEVYSAEEVVYRKGFKASENCLRDVASEPIGGTSVIGDTASPNTVNLAEGHNGLGTNVGENLVVVDQWDLNATMYGGPNSQVTCNLSIIYNIVKP